MVQVTMGIFAQVVMQRIVVHAGGQKAKLPPNFATRAISKKNASIAHAFYESHSESV